MPCEQVRSARRSSSASSRAAASCTSSTRSTAKRSALVVIDMQNAFVAPGAPVEVPAARAIVAPINRLAAELRKRGVPVIWMHAREPPDGRDWAGFFDAFVAPGRAPRPPPRSPPAPSCRTSGPSSKVDAGDLRVAEEPLQRAHRRIVES